MAVPAAVTTPGRRPALQRLRPPWLRGYRRSWLSADLVAGATLAAVAIPEVMGYTAISQTPVVTGLYTVIFPPLLFALLGSSRLLVVGADSATAALMSAGLLSLGIGGLAPYSPEWVAYSGWVALICGLMLIAARLLRLGFLGDFLSASVLVGFLTGVGIQVLSGQIPDLLGIPKGSGNWLEQQWAWITSLREISWATFGFGAATIALIQLFKRFLPRVPGAIVAVVLLIVVSATTDAQAHGVAVVGAVSGGFPPVGLPAGIDWAQSGQIVAVAFSCFILIIAQSAATSRSFAMKHGQRADVNRDIVGLAGANLSAGLTGTFVVNGSPTKTQILDEQRGRSQVANVTMAAIVLLVTLFFTAFLTDMPKAVLAGIVFLIGLSMLDVAGLQRIRGQRVSELLIALLTCGVVFLVGVEQGIILAIAVSVLDIIRRQYSARAFVVGRGGAAGRTYQPAQPGTESTSGLLVLKYDAELFYANANRFVDDVEGLVESAPHPVRCVVLDAASISDIDYSAGLSLGGLLDYLDSKKIIFAVAGADPTFVHLLDTYGLTRRHERIVWFTDVSEAMQRWQSAVPAD